MADDVRITNMPDGGSKERVALDLAKIISHAEHPAGANRPAQPRRHWLQLYAQCLVAVNGGIDAPPIG